MEKKFTKTFQSLDEVFSFVDEFLVRDAVDPSLSHRLKFVIEELFTNMVKYNPNNHDVGIAIAKEQGRIVVRLTDIASERFDPSTTADVDTGLPLETRKIGGLGIHLVKKMVDDLRYEYDGGRSIITVIMNMEHGHV